MRNQQEVQLVEVSEIQRRIISVRSVQVMLDRDLAALYGVEVKQLNRQVKRNIERFPSDFMFQLTKEDCIRCQIGTLYERGGKTLNWSTYRPLAFTENGIAMLSGVLRSPTAIEVNIRIMRAFTVLRHFVSDHAGLVQRVGAIELKQLETDKRIDTVFDALDRGNLLPNGILPAGSEYDSLRYVSRLVESAKSEIVIIDPYSDATTLDVLAKKQPGVTVRLVCKDRGKPTSTEIAKFNRQYQGLTVTYSDDFHDRFVLIDNAELHNLGSSINSLGAHACAPFGFAFGECSLRSKASSAHFRLTTYTTRDAKEIAKILSLLP